MRSLAAVGLSILALALSACSGADNKPGTDTPSARSSVGLGTDPVETSPEDDLITAATDYFDAFFAGNAGTAYDLLSKRCQDLFPQSEFGPIVQAASTTYGKLEVTIDSVEVDGDRGTVKATTGVPALDEDADSDEPAWVLEGGQWHSDKCDT